MKQLLSVCIDQSSTIPDVLDALETLEEYLHQIDNANDFVKVGGVDVALTFLNEEPLFPEGDDCNSRSERNQR